ncbi:hypothetical protein BCD49_07745 [Pseudofrankia sp. EUN1h]|nr:hypothetical protein BCD49_07745 [Pseudofrankia sp. EUN1h]
MFGFIMLAIVSLTLAAPAQAIPQNCTARIGTSGSTGYGTSICKTGTGNHRVRVTCRLGSTTTTYLRYGPWTGIPNPSTVYCNTGDRATAAIYQFLKYT